MNKLLKINQKITIIPDDYKDVFTGVITSIGNNDFTVRLNEGCTVDFDNRNLDISFATQHYLLKFTSNAVCVEENHIKIKFPETYKKIQRREYTRVCIKIPTKCIDPNGGISPLETTTTNLSGGGMQIETDSEIPVGTVLNVKLQLNKHKFVEASFEVLRTEISKYNAEKYAISGVFKKISNIDRITIIQLCFKRQLELRCIGLSDMSTKRR